MRWESYDSEQEEVLCDSLELLRSGSADCDLELAVEAR